MDPDNIAKQKEEDRQIFDTEIEQTESSLKGYTKKEYTFTPLERQLLAQSATVESLARKSQELVINAICLPRVKHQPSNLVHVRYSIGLGRFVVFVPKEKLKKDMNEG